MSMTITECVHCDEFTETVAALPAAATAALSRPSAEWPEAMPWLASHLGVVEHLLHKLARRQLPASSERLRRQHAQAREIHEAMRLVERVLGGDSGAAGVPLVALRAHLLSLVEQYARCERRVLHDLALSLGPGGAATAAAGYASALRAAPSRPHPHAPHRGLLEPVAYRLTARIDRVRDALDSREVRLPQQRAAAQS